MEAQLIGYFSDRVDALSESGCYCELFRIVFKRL